MTNQNSRAKLRMHRWNPRSILRASPFSEDNGFEDPGWRESHTAPTRAYSFYQEEQEVSRALLQRDTRTPDDRIDFPNEILFGEAFPNSASVTVLSFFEVRSSHRGQGIGAAAASLVEEEHRRENLFLAVQTEEARDFWRHRGWNEHPASAWLAADGALAGMSKPAR